MLSGIRKGKKKKQKTSSPAKHEPENPETEGADQAPSSDKNQSIAEQLRQSLAAGKSPGPPPPPRSQNASGGAVAALERRGRISSEKISGSERDDQRTTLLVGAPSLPSSSKAEEDMTVNELAARERAETLNSKISLDEQMTRNMVRLGKKRRRKASAAANEDSDEELEHLKRLLPTEQQDKKPKEKDLEKQRQREVHMQLAQHVRQEKATSRCAWWLDSSSFSKHRLLALGNHVSLVMAPPNSSLSPGNHLYLVPIRHAESFCSCDDDVWGEVQQFLSSLQKLYARERMSVICIETVLPNKGFWQTKMEVVPMPFSAIQDSPIFFRSAMLEQTEEWGTHNKILQTTATKPLKATIPKGFPYFFVGWGNVSTSENTGYAQIIESTEFPADFGLDTVAGMLDKDPVRYARKKKYSHEEEKRSISDFLTKWAKYDWTQQLDG